MVITSLHTVKHTPAIAIDIHIVMQVFVFTAIVTSLLREKLDADAAFAATALIERIRTFNRR